MSHETAGRGDRMRLRPGRWKRASAVVVTAACLTGASLTPALAAVADFYRGKTINIVVGYSVGGGYDVFARLLALHLGRHVPGNPSVVPQNMPGAGSRKAGMYLYEVAPKDGTVIGTIGRNEPIAPLIEPAAKFDGTKFGWIGSIADDNSICLAWHTARIRLGRSCRTAS